MRRRVMAARDVMLRHPWAPRVIEIARKPGPATMGYMESVLTILREGGFSLDLAHHAMHVLGSRVLGFNQELFDDTGGGRSSPRWPRHGREMADTYPNIAELSQAVSHEGGLGACDDDVEFAFGLDLILDGLEQIRTASAGR